MQDPGQRLRRTRENLGLTYRDVEEASHRIASNRGNHEYLVGLSRLADIENKGTVPSVYRMYSLCAIYKLRLENVLSWFGVEIDKLPVDAAQVGLAQTYSFDLSASDHVAVDFPLEADTDIDLSRTFFLSRQIQRWGKLPLSMLGALDLKRNRYAFIGTEDWSMYPIISPGSSLMLKTVS